MAFRSPSYKRLTLMLRDPERLRDRHRDREHHGDADRVPSQRVGDPQVVAHVAPCTVDRRVQRVSGLRHALFVRIDEVTSELIARFHDNPSLALVALPRR